MTNPQPNNPLHAITLKMILDYLVKNVGWEEMGNATGIKCFMYEPRISASLKFLRKTPWARAKVEDLYLRYKEESARPLAINPIQPQADPPVAETC